MTICPERGSIRLGAVLLVGLLTACNAIDTIDPPDLRLTAGSYSNLPRGDYVLTNGKAELLMEAEHLRPGEKRKNNIDLEKLDGIVNIVVRRGDTMIYTQTLRHTPGVPIELAWNEAQETFILTEREKPQPRSTGTKGGGGDGRD